MTEEVEVITLPQLAKRLGRHRTTILRLEQRNVLPKAAWAGPPIRGRVYTEADVKKVTELVNEYFAASDKAQEGRKVLTSVVIKEQ